MTVDVNGVSKTCAPPVRSLVYAGNRDRLQYNLLSG